MNDATVAVCCCLGIVGVVALTSVDWTAMPLVVAPIGSDVLERAIVPSARNG